MSIDKTSVSLFSRKIKSGTVQLQFDGNVLKREKKITFLGMLFDSRLSWKDHVQYVVDKFNKRIHIICCKWWLGPGGRLINKVCLLCMEYGSEVYDSTGKTHKEKVDRI